MGIDTQNAYSHIAIQEMSAVHYPFAFENYHIFYLGQRKHFQYVCNQMITLQN